MKKWFGRLSTECRRVREARTALTLHVLSNMPRYAEILRWIGAPV